MKRITFDTNIWPSVLIAQDFSAIRDAIQNKKIIACIPETIFTLEAINNLDRKKFLEDYKLHSCTTEEILPSGEIKISISIGPDAKAHPGNDKIRSKCMEDSLKMGFKVLRCSGRIGGIVNLDVPRELYLDDAFVDIAERQKVFAECLSKIEARGCGIKMIKDIGSKYSIKSWLDGIANVPQKDWKQIPRAVAEWADGDAIAAHIAYKNDYFCTGDDAKQSGSSSIFSEENKKWLKSEFKVNFLDRKQLVGMY